MPLLTERRRPACAASHTRTPQGRADRIPSSEQHSQDEHPIFASREGTPLGHRNVTKRGFEPAEKEAGLERLTFHSLRHAAASRLIRAALDPVTVASVLGHEDATTTLKVYAHIFDGQRTGEAVGTALAGGKLR